MKAERMKVRTCAKNDLPSSLYYSVLSLFIVSYMNFDFEVSHDYTSSTFTCYAHSLQPTHTCRPLEGTTYQGGFSYKET